MEKLNEKQIVKNDADKPDMRYILKLFGQKEKNDNINIKIEEDKKLIISINENDLDKYARKGQISEWSFNLDQIYGINESFKNIFDNEIENNEFLYNFTENQNFRNIIFIGDLHDSLSYEPFLTFIKDAIKLCFDEKYKNKNTTYLLSYYGINTKEELIDFLNYKNSKESIIKLITTTEDDIVESNASKIRINYIYEFEKVYKLIKKNYNIFLCEEEDNIINYAEIFSIKLVNKENNNKCISKLNFLLYKAYEIYGEIKNEKYYNLFTKENSNFFEYFKNNNFSFNNNSLKCIRDTLLKGKSIMLFSLPIELKYFLLIHDVLNYVIKRNYSVTKFDFDDMKNELSKIESGPKTNEDLFKSKLKRNKFNFNLLKNIENKEQVIDLFGLMDELE